MRVFYLCRPVPMMDEHVTAVTAASCYNFQNSRFVVTCACLCARLSKDKRLMDISMCFLL